MLKPLLLVFVGGGIGSVIRFVLQTITHKWLHTTFPLGILLVNILGSFFIGLALGVWGNDRQHFMRFLFTIGFCGGFTTFSSFSFDNVMLLKDGAYIMFAINIILNVSLCLLATLAGLYLTKNYA